MSKPMCSICQNSQREQIDRVLLEDGVSVEQVALQFGVSLEQLKFHAILHTGEETRPSITRQLKLREADMLTSVAEEYMETLNHLGARINKFVNNDEVKFEKLLTKSVVDLYLGVGSEIRQTIKTLAELNSQINGAQTGAKSGLQSLAEAINASARPRDATG